MKNIEPARELRKQHHRAIRDQHGIDEGITKRAMNRAAFGAQKLNQSNDDARGRKHRVNASRQRHHEFSPVVATSSAMIDTAAELPTMPMWSTPSMILTGTRSPTIS